MEKKYLVAALFALIVLSISAVPAAAYDPNPPDNPPQTCPTCPPASAWSTCSSGVQMRTVYSCSASTGYACQASTETKSCGTPNTCPVCPPASAWSTCSKGQQTRTVYSCSAGTNYICTGGTQTQTCTPPYTVDAHTNIDQADVYLDSNYVCQTTRDWWCVWCDYSCSFSVSGGSHTVKASKSGYDSASGSVYGPPDASITLNLQEHIYSVEVGTSVPYADVYASGTYKCNTGSSQVCTITGLTGTNTIKASKAGYSDASYTVTDGMSFMLSLSQMFSVSASVSKSSVN